MVRFMTALILVGVIGVSAYTIRQNLLPVCERILHYDIGTIDPRFGLSEEDFLSRIQQAESMWEDELDREVFAYKPDSSFLINLVYDERQEKTEERQVAEEELANKRLALNELKLKLDNQEAEYSSKVSLYERRQKQHLARQDKYNQEVQYWNNQGGAPSSVYVELEKEKGLLAKEGQQLEDLRQEVNSLATQVNNSADLLNTEINLYNQYVQEFNNQYGVDEPFDQGLFNGQGIDIYQFESLKDLNAVLAHELGHALGLDHVNDLYAVMYFQQHDNVAVNLELTDEDRAELAAVCPSYQL